jgi:hypothetical protein
MTISLAAELDAFQGKKFPVVGKSEYWSGGGLGCALSAFLITAHGNAVVDHKCEINMAVRHVPRDVLTILLLGMKRSSINGFMPIESRKSKKAVML